MGCFFDSFDNFISYMRDSFYIFAFIPYMLVVLPLPLMNLILMALFVWYAVLGFENTFGLKRTQAYFFGVGIPVFYWLAAALILKMHFVQLYSNIYKS